MALTELNWAHMKCAIESLIVTGSELDCVAVVFATLQALAVRSRNPLEYEALDWPALVEITCRGPLANFDGMLRSYRSTLIWVPGAVARLEDCRRNLFAANFCLWFAADLDADELENPIAESLREMKGLLEQLAMYADAMGKPAIAEQARNSRGTERKERNNVLG